MLSDFTLDHADMERAGMTKVASECSSNVFAVLIKTAQNIVGKFPIGTPNEIEQSIESINQNSNNIPMEILKTARYYIKNAASMNNIELDWKTEKSPRLVKESSFSPKTSEEFDTIGIKGDLFVLDTASNIKLANECLVGSANLISARSMSELSTILIKNASKFPAVEISSIISDYASPELGAGFTDGISFRKQAMAENTSYTDALDSVQKKASQLDPLDVIDAVMALDKTAEFKAVKRGFAYTSLVKKASKDVPIKDAILIEKIAEVATSKEDMGFLEKVL